MRYVGFEPSYESACCGYSTMRHTTLSATAGAPAYAELYAEVDVSMRTGSRIDPWATYGQCL